MVDLWELGELFEVMVDVVVGDEGERDVIVEMDVVVFVEYGFGVFVELNGEGVRSVECGYLDVVGVEMGCFEIGKMGIGESGKGGEEEKMRERLEVLVMVGYVVVFEVVELMGSEED